jgi:hypothetical protein
MGDNSDSFSAQLRVRHLSGRPVWLRRPDKAARIEEALTHFRVIPHVSRPRLRSFADPGLRNSESVALKKEQPGTVPGCVSDAECVTSLGFGIPEDSKAIKGCQHQ